MTLDLRAGYDALAERGAAVHLDRDVVRVSGPEAVSYLQGQMSQDVDAIAVGASAWSLLLQPQGKVDAWLRATRVHDDEFLLDCDGGWGEVVLGRLARFKLRTKAEFEALPWRCVAVRGAAPPTVDAPPAVQVARAEWAGIGGVDLLGPEPPIPDGIDVAPIEAYEVRRIEAGLPRMGAEITDRTIPAEAGVVEVSVSFTKGCYTGQELVARIDSRGGNVPRHLRGVLLDAGPLPAEGTAITADGREIGVLTSAATHPAGHGVGLAMIRRDVEPPAVGLCGGLVTRIRALPLLTSAG